MRAVLVGEMTEGEKGEGFGLEGEIRSGVEGKRGPGKERRLREGKIRGRGKGRRGGGGIMWGGESNREWQETGSL